MFNWLSALFGDKSLQRAQSDIDIGKLSDKDLQIARERLDALAKKAIFGEIGGERPDRGNRAASWWGGNFLGKKDEEIPICAASGHPMHPLLQIRIDELPEIPPEFAGLALINVWMALKSFTFDDAENGVTFAIRTYSNLEDLQPLGFGYRESPDLPTFPIFWKETALEQPSWDDMADELPENIAQSADDEWFFENSPYSSDHYEELRSKYPIKLGGWPAWIQSSAWPKNGQFFFQVDATDKGKLFLGDAGSFYIFKTPESWAIRKDCY